jgi:hypothetical protein
MRQRRNAALIFWAAADLGDRAPPQLWMRVRCGPALTCSHHRIVTYLAECTLLNANPSAGAMPPERPCLASFIIVTLPALTTQ